ncbi:MAG: DNA-binding response regulator [SAR324 cluster bacterium]|uniref:DNA-binding response regulator n=1 Tax=SAR324 cluster bacterium TaxID=2024889 RepID=A0A2A4T3V9_9DELT|nr:MAG: DNA-binding response regulator [SAR324 cluster bacterium]
MKAVIADDEKALRTHLIKKLRLLWPELVICHEASNGIEALESIQQYQPDVAFLDIKMPGKTGIEVARQIDKSCQIVFITAFDHYAVEAFENEAIDYLLKPITDQRLNKTIQRLKESLSQKKSDPAAMQQAMLRALNSIQEEKVPNYLTWIKASADDGIQLISVEDIEYFYAEEKYTIVVNQNGEFLIRKTIKTLAQELDPDQFWQIHRGTIVNVNFIETVKRSFTGQLQVKLKTGSKDLSVSRGYAHLFKQM